MKRDYIHFIYLIQINNSMYLYIIILNYKISKRIIIFF